MLTTTVVTPPSGRGLVIPFFFRGFFCFFGGHLPQTSGFRSAKQILVVSFATQARAFISSDRSIFYTPGGGGGENNGGVQCPWGFSCFLIRGSDCKYRESADKLKKSKNLITCQKNTFVEPSSKILLKPSGILLFSGNSEKRFCLIYYAIIRLKIKEIESACF